MLGFHSHQRYFVCTSPIDMRKGIDGLCGATRQLLEEDPLSGFVFIFFNKSRDKIKLLVWDQDGYVLYAKRLEKGRFEELQNRAGSKKITLPFDHLVMLIGGLSIRHVVQRKRYGALSTN